MAESRLLGERLQRLSQLDRHDHLYEVVWRRYPGAIRVLLNSCCVFQTYWDHQNGLAGSVVTGTRFAVTRKAAHASLSDHDYGTVPSIVFQRLYTLRNELIHGGAICGAAQ